MAISLPIISTFDKRGVDRARNALSSFASFAADVAKVAGAAIAAVGVASVREASQFESTFARIQGLVGVTEAEIEQLKTAAQEIGPAFGIAATEAADALFFITSAGLRGAEATEVLEAAAKASAVGLGDLNEIANVATGAMNAYGSEMLSGTEAVEALTEAVRLGQFAPEELAGSLGQVIGISAELGVSFQETTGLIAALTRSSLPASQAVTGIRGAMQALLRPTQEAANLLDQYGYSTDQVRSMIEDDGLLATFTELREAFGDNEEEFTRVVGSIEGLNAVLTLTGENSETYREIVQNMTDDIGVLDEAFAITSETAQFKFDQAMAESRNILLEIGESLQDRLLPYLERFNTWVSENKDGIVGAFDLIFGAVDKVATGLLNFLADLSEDEEFMKTFEEFKTTMSELEGPAEDVAEALGEITVALAPLAGGLLRDIAFGLGGIAKIIGGLVGSVNTLTGTMPEASDEVENFEFRWSKFIPVIGAYIGEDGLLNALGNAVTGMRENLEAEAPMIADFWSNMATVFDVNLEEMDDAVSGTLRNMLRVFGVNFDEIEDETETWGGNITGILDDIGGDLYRSALDIMQGFWDGLKSKWSEVSKWFANKKAEVQAFFRDPLGWLVNQGRQTLQGFFDGLLAVWSSVRKWFERLQGQIKSAFGDPGGLLYGAGRSIMDGLLSGLNSNWGGVWSWVSSRADRIKKTFEKAMKIKSPSQVFEEYGVNIMQGLLNGLQSLDPAVDAQINNTLSSDSLTMPEFSGMTATGGMTGSSVYNITVNAGVGTNGAEVGRAVVNAIQDYERRNGKVFAAA